MKPVVSIFVIFCYTDTVLLSLFIHEPVFLNQNLLGQG